jgi:hypothetical protein
MIPIRSVGMAAYQRGIRAADVKLHVDAINSRRDIRQKLLT